MPLKVLDLFSGIGGFSLGLERTGGFETVAFCEIDPFCRQVLAKHWPDVPIFEDVRELTADAIGPVDIITGGFPCQDISQAGKKAGIDGERTGLWAELARLVSEIRPRYVIMENVPNLLVGPSEQPGGWFCRVLGDLAAGGYDAEWQCISASDVGAPHERDRVWIVSYPNLQHGEAGLGVLPIDQATLCAIRDRNRNSIWLASARPPPGVANGVSGALDRRPRTEGLGNAVTHVIPGTIGHAILEADAA